MRRTISHTLAAALFWAVAATGTYATPPEPFVEEVVVVAHKDPRPLRSVAANISVVTREALDAQLASSLSDVFRYVPGIDDVTAGSRFGSEGVNVRGIGGNRVALVLDGVPLSHQFSIGRFSNATRDFIDTGLIQRVEVLHGPASALYGSSAIGGVVVVQTPRPSDILRDAALGGSLRLTRHNGDDSDHAQALVAAGSDALGITAGVSARAGHEVDTPTTLDAADAKDYERQSGVFNVFASDAAGRTLRMGLIHQRAQTDSWLRSMLGSGRFSSTTALSGEDEFAMSLASLEVDLSTADSFFSQALVRAYTERVDVDQDTVDVRGAARRPVRIERAFEYDQDITGLELNLQRDFVTGTLEHRLGFGVEWTEYRTEELRDGSQLGLDDGVFSTAVLGEQFPLRDFPISVTRELGAYVEDTVTVGRWTLIGALRAERYRLNPEPDAIFREDNPDNVPVSIAQSDVSPKFGAIYRLAPAFDVYVQYAHGFRAPPFEDANIGFDLPLFNYRAIPNPDLRSETSQSIDLGLRWSGRAARAHLGLFHTRYEDFIESKVRLGNDPVSGALIFQSQNRDEATIEGVEASWRAQLGGALDGFDIDATAYWARGENKDNGEPLNSVGPPQAVTSLNWVAPSGRTRVGLRGTFTDSWSRRDQSTGDLFVPAGHAIFDLYLHRQLSDRARLSASVRNLADRTYWRWSDVRGLSPDDPVLPVLAGPGRNVSLSLDMRW